MNKIIMLIMILMSLNLNTSISQDYSFLKPNNDLRIVDVEYHNGKIYLLGSESIGHYSIQAFDTDDNTFETLYISNDLNERGFTKIKDMIFFENELYVINDNKLINLSNGYSVFSFADEYDFEPHSDKYRQMYNLTVRGNSLLIGSSSADVLSRDTLQGTPVAYIEGFSELLEYKSGSIKRIVDGRNSKDNFNLNYSPVLDNQNNLWFRENQSKPLKGGLIKVNPINEVEVFDLKPYSQVSYLIKPSSIDIIDNFLYMGLFPRKESNYLEGLSIYNLENKEWNYTIDYLESNENFNGINWEVPTKIKELNDGDLAILGYNFTIQHNSGYFYFDLQKAQKEKFGEVANYRNLDLFETESQFIIIRANGILVFEKSSITNVEDELQTKYTYTIISNTIKFENTINNYKLYDLLGKAVKSGEDVNTIEISNLIAGLYFILLNKEYILRFIKE